MINICGDIDNAKEAIYCVEKLYGFAFQAKCLANELENMKSTILNRLCSDRFKKGSTFYSSLHELFKICQGDVSKFSTNLFYVLDTRFKMAVGNGKLEDSK